KRRSTLEEQRTRLLRAHLEGAVPLDLLKTEQDRTDRIDGGLGLGDLSDDAVLFGLEQVEGHGAFQVGSEQPGALFLERGTAFRGLAELGVGVLVSVGQLLSQ